ncbi:FAD-dependent oxidoreductase [Porticoccus sp. W117]|uniref:NAD(P)/FAD-dependent oxidoreductase n=1 Tax=Porticoccus sp. W117 TaxID=3054777 RepID=UPI0025951DF8|nr:FAD-dependent oxidoreductase [Porticoccus sp. W117]MDM3869967.1 FAD-dependent oxidoreductase [Porticoccus sp. W117]
MNSPPMEIAVVGSGISGLACAYYLDKSLDKSLDNSPGKKHRVTLFESSNYPGGHVDTHDIHVADKYWHIDSGFIVFNEENYPNFCRLLNELGVASQRTTMSFSVSDPVSGLEYNATNLDKLFCQRRNIFSPAFQRMIKDLMRFYRQAPTLLEDESNQQTLGEYLRENRYSDVFIEKHLIPMACALWSGPSASIEQFPARYFVQFMHNHHMLTLSKRPQWRVVKDGSSSYVDALLEKFTGDLHVNTPVEKIRRTSDGVTLQVNGQSRQFDQVVLACHSDQALALLEDATDAEQQVLGSIAYQNNHMLLHSDISVLPRHLKAWACWNVRLGADLYNQCTVSYHMNQLQGLGSAGLQTDNGTPDFIVSLNCEHLIDPEKVYAERHYSHPVYNAATLAAQHRWSQISGHNRTHYCGAYWGWGFHEDGVRSALRVVDHIEGNLVNAHVT